MAKDLAEMTILADKKSILVFKKTQSFPQDELWVKELAYDGTTA